MSDAVVAALRAALEDDPQQADMRLHLAEMLLMQGSPGEALEHAQVVLTAEPDNARALTIAGDACQSLGESEKTLAYKRLLATMSGSAPPEGSGAPPAGGDSMNRQPGHKSRAREVWRWCSLLPFIGALPGCVVMAKRRHARWAFGFGAVTVLWFALTAVAGATTSNAGGSNAANTAVGLAILVLYAVQVIALFCAPATTPVARQTRAGRAGCGYLSFP